MWSNPRSGYRSFSVASRLTSLAVHTAVLNNTPWMANFYSGKDMAATAAVNIKGTSPVVLKTDDGKAAFAVNITPATGDSSSFVIKVDRLPGDLALAGPPPTVK